MPVQITINAPELAEAIADVVARNYGLPVSIASDRDPFFPSNFRSLVCYFLGIQQKHSMAFHPQTKGQTDRVPYLSLIMQRSVTFNRDSLDCLGFANHFTQFRMEDSRQDQIRFPGYAGRSSPRNSISPSSRSTVFAQGVWIEDKRIKAADTWPEPKSVRELQVFIGFASFYQHIWASAR